MTIPVSVSTNNVSFSVGVIHDVNLPVETNANWIFPVSVGQTDVVFPVGAGSNHVVLPTKCGIGMYSATYLEYEGSYEFTPSGETQTIDIRNMIARDDIVINPIPSNYGLVTWNGSVITVS